MQRISQGRMALLGTLLLVFSFEAEASLVTVDGNLAEWGVVVGNNNTTTYPVATVNKNGQDGLYGRYAAGNHTTASGLSYSYFIEDFNDTTNSGTLGPNAGGQDYDGEFLGVGREGDDLVIAILTGQRPDNGKKLFSPGDIRIQTSTGVFGIEVGGGVGGSGAGFSSRTIHGGESGTTYSVDGSGHTIDPIIIGSDSQHKAGALYSNASWINDPIPSPTTPVQMQLTGGEYRGTSEYIYHAAANSQHAVIELRVNMSWFLLGQQSVSFQNISWYPSCGNDELLVNLLGPGGSLPGMSFATPEPSGICLLAMAGLTCLGGLRRRKQSC